MESVATGSTADMRAPKSSGSIGFSMSMDVMRPILAQNISIYPTVKHEIIVPNIAYRKMAPCGVRTMKKYEKI